MPIEWTPEETRQIEMSLEVRRRERREIAEELVRKACSRGEHVPKDGKCIYCGWQVAEAPPVKKNFSPIE